ncbi:bifunctional nuclease family protein [Nemorincola caseinilytica]|uniref:Bifunctional nuclease family protein n=1 Tax=Nemorincola caseinilytica TaxID=2054315 RepID=A0ABP8NMZ3_9BACT
MKKVELEIVALSHSITQTHSYAVVLGEVDGMRRLPIVIGGFEAQAIAVALERMQPSRPLTHDLFANFMETFSIELTEVIIYKLEEGVFFAKLICRNSDIITEIDSRTSDALALAVRANCRIYTYENIIDAAGLYLENEESVEPAANEAAKAADVPVSNKSKTDPDMKNMSLDELNKLLQTVLEQEDYVRAIHIRDEINSRRKK